MVDAIQRYGRGLDILLFLAYKILICNLKRLFQRDKGRLRKMNTRGGHRRQDGRRRQSTAFLRAHRFRIEKKMKYVMVAPDREMVLRALAQRNHLPAPRFFMFIGPA